MRSSSKKLVCFASGTGTLFEHVILTLSDLSVPTTLEALITDQPQCGAAKLAQKNHIPVHPFPDWTPAHRLQTSQAISETLTQLKPDLILLLGFMKILDDAFVKRWHLQTLNTHPSLLPSFRGTQGVGDALQAGAKITGATLHHLSASVDSGPILWQRPVPCFAADTPETLHRRIKQVEKAQLIHALEYVLSQSGQR